MLESARHAVDLRCSSSDRLCSFPPARRDDGNRFDDLPGLAQSQSEILRGRLQQIEAVIFAASTPVTRETLVRVVGRHCNIELIINDIRAELAGRPYELVSVAGGWQHRTKKAFGDVIRAATGPGDVARPLSQSEALVLMCIAYFQPITRGELSSFFGKEVSRDLIGVLRSQDLIASGPRSPQLGAPYTYVTTKSFLSHFGFDSCATCLISKRLRTPGCYQRKSCSRAIFRSAS